MRVCAELVSARVRPCPSAAAQMTSADSMIYIKEDLIIPHVSHADALPCLPNIDCPFSSIQLL